MYRDVLILLALLCAGSCHGRWWGHHHDHNHSDEGDSGYHMSGYGHQHHGWHHGWHHHENWHAFHDRHFDSLSASVIESDQYSQSACKNYSNTNTQEIQELLEYKLVYTLQGCDPDNIMVQIKHRVIYMYAKKSNEDDSENYYDVRILPKMLKTVDATWTYDGEILTVLIPYDLSNKYKLNAEEKCLEVNDNVITVPKAPHIQYKYGQ